MKSLLDHCSKSHKWIDFHNFYSEKIHYKETELLLIESIIINKEYLKFTSAYVISLLSNKVLEPFFINKGGQSKKRIVFNLDAYSTIIIKFITYILRDYDQIFSKSLFSYRVSNPIGGVIKGISNTVDKSDFVAYKVDIQSYFISIDKTILLSKLEGIFPEDYDFLLFCKTILNLKVSKDNLRPGALPGLSISNFFANVYLMDLDAHFENTSTVYFRYADDIIIFDRIDRINSEILSLKNILSNNKLVINSSKEVFYKEFVNLEFLGFKFGLNSIDISDAGFIKIKRRIKRFSNKLKSQIVKKQINNYEALSLLISSFNKKFYSKVSGELCWTLWYFPSITTTNTLKMIDHYFQEECRSLITLKYKKSNIAKVPYATLSLYGYKPLVSAYYEQKL